MNAAPGSLDLIFKGPGNPAEVRFIDGCSSGQPSLCGELMLWLESQTIHCSCRHFLLNHFHLEVIVYLSEKQILDFDKGEYFARNW